MSVLHARSVRANLARIEKRLEANQRERARLEYLRGVFRGELPEPARADSSVPETHEEPQAELITVPAVGYETATGYEGDDPNAPQATNAEHVGIVSTNDAQGQRTKLTIVESHEKGKLVDPMGILAVAGIKLVEGRRPSEEQASGTGGPARKRGWQKGLSRKKTPCPQSPIPHRHRIDDPSKLTELTCVGITYPDKAATKTPALALPCTHRLGQKEAP